ncbi:Glycoside hydrolase family 15 protein [Candidatus Nitrotoga sp. BS]|uniref:glycoside hydrolase family 15 protein n=1 Tax=Candidatus Nitrotoga sp. BS TaxID=2890408 RepID=UPI001EF35820|nr:glycoside hydrolase family 15 protein [Candidatus Nitrotoga sp. BS]CAH1195024.1 Glycoside hydrolase family 15 protein [Candidatus Nitrotoga sp. BS]
MTHKYTPIRDYAVIGDCHGSALVGLDGSIDWCALRRFDADPIFCRLLDAGLGGFWSVRPAGPMTVTRAYVPDTNVLVTTFTTPTGTLRVTDFMPVGRQIDASAHDYVSLSAPNWVVRRVEVVSGQVDVKVRYRPSRHFARDDVTLTVAAGVVTGIDVPSLHSDLPFVVTNGVAEARVTLGTGACRDMVLAGNSVSGVAPATRVCEFLNITLAFWQEWIAYCRYNGPYAETVKRSALVLKAMTYAPTGALVAALTTSLPEQIGGERNWDYRYTWLRDGSLMLYALAALGYSGEARNYHRFLATACRETLPRVQIMYGIDHSHALHERVIEHLEGYQGSRPVRVGNGAYLQQQIDVYGETLDLALLSQSLGEKLSVQYLRLLQTFAEFVAAHWQDPDQGLWEMRGPPRHHVHGKLMSWVAMDRAAQLFSGAPRWQKLADTIHADIMQYAIDPVGGHLRQAYDGGVDAAVLLAPMLAFPLDRKILERTIDVVEKTLGNGDFVLRYRGEDGLPGEEGAFLICSFWLVDAKLAVGRIDEARGHFERLLGYANDVGLYAEEADIASGAFLGNFPQAFTHLALVNSAAHLDLYERFGANGLQGSHADRAKRSVIATFGWRGIVASIRVSGLRARLWSSDRSKLAWP